MDFEMTTRMMAMSGNASIAVQRDAWEGSRPSRRAIK
jgi:hypothetical protein